eukprot:scaffold150094_cov38-Prasinocladus_malaysianus.AAC.2
MRFALAAACTGGSPGAKAVFRGLPRFRGVTGELPPIAADTPPGEGVFRGLPCLRGKGVMFPPLLAA